jgi:hypothetical protein
MLRRENVEPRCMVSRMLMDDPIIPVPYTETLDPNRINDLKLIDDPKCKKSMTDKDDPNLETP